MEYVPSRDLVRTVADGFTTAFDGRPESIGRAPGRVNLIGEHTDYNRGLCLPIALEHSTWVALTPRVDGRVRVVSAQADAWSGSVSESTGWPAYVTATLRELGVRGADVYVDSDVPLGSGLSSSAALICALSVALGSHSVAAAVRAETDGVGAPTGGLDQTISMLGRPGEALLLDFDSGTRTRVPFAPEDADLSLLVIDTRVSHSHASGGYGSRRQECEDAAERLGVPSLREVTDPEADGPRVRHVVTENQRVSAVVEALTSGDWPAVGALFTASHMSLRDDFEVSCVELDEAVSVALDAGAWGARMTGGGFGGSAIALVPTDRVDIAARSVEARFAELGYAVPGFLRARASAGAALVTAT